VALSYEVSSERLEEIARSPSGWVPPQSMLVLYHLQQFYMSMITVLINSVMLDLNNLIRQKSCLNLASFPSDPSPSLPFEIKRSKTNNLPVYVDKKRGGSLVLTVIRNIKGDLNVS
jgi:hypothetical protein